MTTPTAEQTKAAHARRKEKGWVRMHYWMSPEAQAALERKRKPGESRTQAIERLILK